MFALDSAKLTGEERAAYQESISQVRKLLVEGMYLDVPRGLAETDLEDVYTPLDKCILNNRAFRSLPMSEVISCRRALDTAISIYMNNSLEPIHSDNTFIAALCERLVTTNGCIPKDDSVVFVTTNWDIILDNSIQQAIGSRKGVIDYCCHATPYYNEAGNLPALVAHARGYFTVKILKMHGSLNWLFCPRCDRLYTTTREKIAIHEYIRHPTCRLCDKRFRNDSTNDKGPPLVGQLLMPTYIKDLGNVQIKLVWQNAGIELSEATRLVFAGYSFPIADFEFRELLARTVPHSTEIHVVTRHDTSPEVEKRYRSFFGRRSVTIHKEGVEKALVPTIWET